MKIKNVLEIEYMPIFDDKFVVKIKTQNTDILARGEFEDVEINVKSSNYPMAQRDRLYIQGTEKEMDNRCMVVSREVLGIIINKVALVNKKYGIKVRERVTITDRYYYIDCWGDIQITADFATDIDNTLYKAGNYFSTRQEAEDSLIYKAFQKTKEDLRKNESRSKKIC